MRKRKLKLTLAEFDSTSQSPDPFALSRALILKVRTWSSDDYPPVNGREITHTTRELLRYWFKHDSPDFYRCQQEAMETIVYCFEILGNPIPKEIYSLFAPEELQKEMGYLKKIGEMSQPRYCIKMATGTGKTWILILVIVWQFLNRMREKDPRFIRHFLVVAPGLIVYERLLDAFLGKKRMDGKRDPTTADISREGFVIPEWRDQFDSIRILTKENFTHSTEISDAPFILLTNWHRINFVEKKGQKDKVWETLYPYLYEDDETITEVIRRLLTANADLCVLNDEAHHAHEAKDETERRWQESINIVTSAIGNRSQFSFFQLDFSATPFEGLRGKRIYFPHIVYEYDIISAMRQQLVKQIFLEERNRLTIDDLDKVEPELQGKLLKLELTKEDIRAVRDKRSGKPIDLSMAQKLLIQIGVKKLEQLEKEWGEQKVFKKPVLFILAEDNEVADLVEKEFARMVDWHDKLYTIYDKFKPENVPTVLTIHSDRKGQLSDEEYEKIRNYIFNIDDPSNPVKVIISVMMLKEGFDVNNICVIAGLRALESDVLAEQTIGRGLRLMFHEPEFEQPKFEAFTLLQQKKTPTNSFDQLFIVEHPTFRRFYEWIEKKGGFLGRGSSIQISGMGDFITVEPTADRISKYDMAWPEEIVTDYGSAKFDFAKIDLESLDQWPLPFEEMKNRAKVFLAERYTVTRHAARKWAYDTDIFDYNYFLRGITSDLLTDGKNAVLSAYSSEIMGLADDYCKNFLFGRPVNYDVDNNHHVLNILEVAEFAERNLRKTLWNFILVTRQETALSAKWRRLSHVKFWRMKKSVAVSTERCIYPSLPFGYARGLEKRFVTDVLESSNEVLAYSKIMDYRASRHLAIRYLANDGNYASYYPDFLVKTKDKMYVVETKLDKDFERDPDVRSKAVASVKMCSLFSEIECPVAELRQPKEWEYVIFKQSAFEKNLGLTFDQLVETIGRSFTALLVREAGKPYRRTQMRLTELVQIGESETLEFKSSMRWDYNQGKVNKDLEHSVAKTLCAFMDTEGGTLVIGVNNKGEPLGLEKDLETLKKKDKDGFELAFTNLVNAYIGPENRALCHLKFERRDGKEVAIIKIEKSRHPVYVGAGDQLEFYVRSGNSSQPLNIREALQYVQEHEWTISYSQPPPSIEAR
jgi:type III restriction enzyme